jgi:protoheme IX farnesyltransferase
MSEPTVSGALPMSDLDLSPASSGPSVLGKLQDLARLGKPRLSTLVLFTTAGGLRLAPGHISFGKALLTITMTMLAVASANTFNCYIERDSDRLMKRTRTRPLPQGRLDPRLALAVGFLESAIALPALTFGVNVLTGALATLAVVSYVALYTPMKTRSASAVVIGAIPGAIPPLLGWTAVTGHLDPGGLALFGVMFFWQLPHFLAVALYLQDDYARAGIRVMPLSQGDRATHIWIVLTTAMLVPATLVLTPLHVAGRIYFVVALVSGLGLFFWSINGIELPKGTSSAQWARRLFLGTIGYLTLLFIVLGLNAA